MREILNSIAAHFHINPDEISSEKILHGNREKQNVHRLRIREKSYLLKLHDIRVSVTESGYTPFQIENYVLSTLNKSGCPVPQIVWVSEKHHLLLLNWCGNETLDSLTQSKSNSDLTLILDTILIELCKLETFFAEQSAQFRPYVFQFDLRHSLRQLLRQGRKTIGYMEHLSTTPLTETQMTQLDVAWNSVANRLLSAQPIMGGLDYQANNIVIKGQLPYFIDFASIGWDWQERRLVQFYNSIGANQRGSNFISLLNRELIDTYAEWVTEHRELCSVSDVAFRVDGHHLLFYLSVVHRILEAVAKPEQPNSKILLDAWGNMQNRFKRAISLIIDVKLSDDSYTNQIREMIGAFH